MNEELRSLLTRMLNGESAAIGELRTRAANDAPEALFTLGALYAAGKGGLPKSADKATEHFRRAAELGHAEAAFRLGLALEKGDGAERDESAAAEWYEKAAAHDLGPALLNLAGLYLDGRGVDQDEERAFDLYSRACGKTTLWPASDPLADVQEVEAVVVSSGASFSSGAGGAVGLGLALARYHLGNLYFEGRGVEADEDEAADLYRLAAEQGFAPAQYNLSVCYREDRGLERRRLRLAAEWCAKAAEQGFADAQYNLGDMYWRGEGVEEDAEQAAAWFRRAGEQGHCAAYSALGEMYRQGDGVEQDLEQAAVWYQKAWEQGDVDAALSLGRMYSSEGEPLRAVEWFEKAAERGDVMSMMSLSDLYREGAPNFGEGDDLAPDAERAVSWMRRAAEEHDEAQAMRFLGDMYRKGKIVARDMEQALAWYERASENGDRRALCCLADILRTGEGGVAPDPVRARECYLELVKPWGHDEASFGLGELYRTGAGVDQDFAQAVEWYEKSDNGSARLALFRMYMNGEGVDRDPDKALEWLEKASDYGLAEATVLLAGIYRTGEGVSRDMDKAVDLYEEASYKDYDAESYAHVLAAFRALGEIYRDGEGGVEKNEEDAAYWFGRAEQKPEE